MSSPTPQPPNQPSTFPEPYIIQPTLPHKNTLILLHGTSTTGPTFASTILSFPISISASPTPSNLPLLFPSTRLVFPTGSPRRVAVLHDMANAWFDMRSFEDRTIGEDDQVEGLRESIRYLGDLVRKEVGIVKAEGKSGRVVLGGFSQGTAVGVVGVLSGEFCTKQPREVEVDGDTQEGIVGFLGLSGWLPFRREVDEVLSRVKEDHQADKAEMQRSAMRYIRDLLGLDNTEIESSRHLKDSLRSVDIPVYLCHGKNDRKMKVEWGREMAHTLSGSGMRCCFTEYDGLEHWYGDQEMVDVVHYLRLLFGEDGTNWERIKLKAESAS